MRIAIDTTFFGHEEIKNKNLTNSTSIFTADLLKAFDAIGLANNFTLIINESHKSFFKEAFPNYKLLVLKWIPLTVLHFFSFGKLNGTKYIKKFGIYRKTIEKHNFNLIWFPFAGDYTYVKTSIPSVLTIHDLWGFHSNLNNFRGYKDIINSPQNTIVCISEYTKNDFVHIFNYKKIIHVIPNSIQLDISETQAPAIGNGNFILNINAYISKKNPMTLLKAFNLIKEKIPHNLIFCGGYKDDLILSEMHSFITDNNLEQRVYLLYRVSNEERNWLLSHASIFVTPSLFEGFGRTPVEAAICKIPVISTKETSLFEATMGLCNYIENPKDENEFANMILEKIQNPDDYKTLEEIAKKLSANYNSKKLSIKYWDLFNQILNET